MYPRNVVCFRNIFVNALYKGDNNGGGGGGGYYYNDETKLYSVLVNTAQTPLNFSLGP